MFSPGDKVLCVDFGSYPDLANGKIYTVKWCDAWCHLSDCGNEGGFTFDRFKLITPPASLLTPLQSYKHKPLHPSALRAWPTHPSDAVILLNELEAPDVQK